MLFAFRSRVLYNVCVEPSKLKLLHFHARRGVFEQRSIHTFRQCTYSVCSARASSIIVLVIRYVAEISPSECRNAISSNFVSSPTRTRCIFIPMLDGKLVDDDFPQDILICCFSKTKTASSSLKFIISSIIRRKIFNLLYLYNLVENFEINK